MNLVILLYTSFNVCIWIFSSLLTDQYYAKRASQVILRYLCLPIAFEAVWLAYMLKWEALGIGSAYNLSEGSL